MLSSGCTVTGSSETKDPSVIFLLLIFIFFPLSLQPWEKVVWWKGTLHWPEECCSFSGVWHQRSPMRSPETEWDLASHTKILGLLLKNFFVVFGISQEDPILVWKTGWEAWNEYSRAPGGWQSGWVPWLGGESSQRTWSWVRGSHLCKGCPEVSLNSLSGQMSLLDWSLKELGVPEVCCALQCFPLEGFGEKG